MPDLKARDLLQLFNKGWNKFAFSLEEGTINFGQQFIENQLKHLFQGQGTGQVLWLCLLDGLRWVVSTLEWDKFANRGVLKIWQ